MKSIKNYYIAAACCACAVLPGHMTAQEANDSTKANFFNAMDYIRQKRYIPEGRKVDPQAKGRNVSVSAFGGASKLAGEGSWMPMSKEFGVSLTKDVTSFNSYRLTLEGAQNKQMKRGGVEIAHLFRIMDYVWGYNDRTAWNVETVIGLGGYTTQLTKDDSRHYAGALFGGLHVSYLLGSHLEMFAEPRLNLFTDGIDGRDSQKKYDLGAQAVVGLTYRFTGIPMDNLPRPNADVLDNLFYEFYVGIQGDYSARVRRAPQMNGLLEPVGPAMGIGIGKWFLPLGVRGTIFGGLHRTVPDDGKMDTRKEVYAGLRLEGMLNLNRLFNCGVTDPKLEVNLTGGVEVGGVAHRGKTYAKKVRPFIGPTAGGQLLYAVNDRIGVFGQARWSRNNYTQTFVGGRKSQDRRMQNLSVEMGVQYRRRAEDVNKKDVFFEPYNFASVAVGASYPMRSGDQNLKKMMHHLGQQFSLSYGRRYSQYASVRGNLEVGHLQYRRGGHTYPLTLGADYMVDFTALAAGYNRERICTVEGFAGILYTHHGAARKDYFGMQGGLKETFRVNDRWGIFAEEAMRVYKGAIIPGARTLTNGDFSLMPYANLGVSYIFWK